MKHRAKKCYKAKNIELCIAIIHMIWFNTYRWFAHGDHSWSCESFFCYKTNCLI